MRKFREKDRAPINACSTVKLSVETYNTVYPKCRLRKDLPRENDYVYVLIPFERIATDAILDVWGVKKDGSPKYKSSYIKVVNETLRYPTEGMLEKLEGANVPEKKKEDIKKIVAIVNAYQSKLKEKGLDFLEPINPESAKPQEQPKEVKEKTAKPEKETAAKKKFDELLTAKPTEIKAAEIKMPVVVETKSSDKPETKAKESKIEDVPVASNNAQNTFLKEESVIDNIPSFDITPIKTEPAIETNTVPAEEVKSAKEETVEDLISDYFDETPVSNNNSVVENNLLTETIPEAPADETVIVSNNNSETEINSSSKSDDYPEDEPKEVPLDLDFSFDTTESHDEDTNPSVIISTETTDSYSSPKEQNTEKAEVSGFNNSDSGHKEIDFSLNLTIDDILDMEENNSNQSSVTVVEPNPNDEVFPDDYFDDYFEDESAAETSDNSTAETVEVKTETTKDSIPSTNITEVASSNENTTSDENSSSEEDDDDIYKDFFKNY